MFDLEERVKALRDGPHAGYERGQRLAVRVGEDLSSLRNCCSANCQNSASRSSGWPACPQSLYARASISCLFGSGIMIAPGFGARSRLSGGVGLIARTVPDQLGDWTADSSPHEVASSSGRLAHKTQAMLALPWPLPGLPAPRELAPEEPGRLPPRAPTKYPLNAAMPSTRRLQRRWPGGCFDDALPSWYSHGFTSCCATRTFPSCNYSIAGEALSVRILNRKKGRHASASNFPELRNSDGLRHRPSQFRVFARVSGNVGTTTGLHARRLAAMRRANPRCE